MEMSLACARYSFLHSPSERRTELQSHAAAHRDVMLAEQKARGEQQARSGLQCSPSRAIAPLAEADLCGSSSRKSARAMLAQAPGAAERRAKRAATMSPRPARHLGQHAAEWTCALDKLLARNGAVDQKLRLEETSENMYRMRWDDAVMPNSSNAVATSDSQTSADSKQHQQVASRELPTKVLDISKNMDTPDEALRSLMDKHEMLRVKLKKVQKQMHEHCQCARSRPHASNPGAQQRLWAEHAQLSAEVFHARKGCDALRLKKKQEGRGGMNCDRVLPALETQRTSAQGSQRGQDVERALHAEFGVAAAREAPSADMLGSETGPDIYRVTGKRPRGAGLHLELPDPLILPEFLTSWHPVNVEMLAENSDVEDRGA